MFNALGNKSAFSVMLGFIRSFHEVVLGESLADHIPNELWKEALDIQEYGEELFNRARQRIKDEEIDSNNIIPCPRCGRPVCVLLEDTCRCYVCAAEEHLRECESCHRLVPESWTEPSWTGTSEDEMWQVYICKDCVDAAEDVYIQHLIDLKRGK